MAKKVEKEVTEMSLGKNIEAMINGNFLTLTIDLSKNQGKSSSGKSIIIASTKGNLSIVGTEAVIGLNIYKKA